MPDPVLRDWDSMLRDINVLRDPTTPAAVRQSLCAKTGLKYEKRYFAFDPRYMPGVDPATGAPQDGLHLFGDGLLRSELAWCMNRFIKMGINIDAINRSIAMFNKKSHIRIPPLYESYLKESTIFDTPKSDSTIRMTGSQMSQFALHR